MRIDDVQPEYAAQYFRFDMPDDEQILYSDGKVAFEGAFTFYARGVSLRVVLTGRPLEPLLYHQ